MRRSWSAPGVDIERDARVAVADGEIVGFAAIKVEDVHTWIELHGQGLAELIDWARRSLAAASTPAAGSANEEVRAALLEKGFDARSPLVPDGDRPRRRDCPEPRWPDGISRARLPRRRRAGRATRRTWRRSRTRGSTCASRTTSGRTGSLERPGFDPELWLLATAEEEIAGIALCRVHETDPRTGWVSILGVRRPWRRQGSGGRCCSSPSAGSRRTGARASFSASTRRASPVRIRSTRVPACA